MKNFHPTRHQYQSPSQINQKQENREQIPEQSKTIQQLQARLRARQIATTPLMAAPQHKRKPNTYSNAVTNTPCTPSTQTENQETKAEIIALKAVIDKQNMSIKQIPHRLEPSPHQA